MNANERSVATLLLDMEEPVLEGKLAIPNGVKMPLQDAASGYAAVAIGGAGKNMLVVDQA